MITQLATVIARLADTGVAVLLAEQNLTLALAVADQVTVLHNRTIALRGGTADLRADPTPLRDLLAMPTAPPTPPPDGRPR